MNITISSLQSAIVIALLSGRLIGGPMAFTSIQKLATQADAVVVGVAQQSAISGTTITLHINVARTLKGSAQPGDFIYASWSAATPMQIPSAIGTPSGIWFLKTSPGGWMIQPTAIGDISFFHTYLPVPAGPLTPAYQISAGSSVIDKVANEIAAALDVTQGQSALMVPLQLGWLDVTGSPMFQQALVRFGNSSSGPVQALGIQALVRGGDAASLAKVASAPSLRIDPSVAGAVCEYRNSDAGGIASLGGLISPSSPAALRTCAAHALRTIHTRETLPFLASLLDADTPDLRYEGVAGLASFANNFPIQTPTNTANMGYLTPQGRTEYTTDDVRKNFPGKALFQQQETSYIAFWKAWWTAHRTDF